MQSTVTTEVSPGIILARIPVPFPLKFVNCYLVAVEGGWVLIDAGLRYPAAEEAWQRALAEVGINAAEIQAIYLTHYHPDHYGLAGLWQQRSGAPVYMSPLEAETAAIVWGNHDRVAGELSEFFRMYGMPADIAGSIAQQMRQVAAMTLPHAQVTPLDDGRLPLLPDYQPLIYAGHTDGHLCLYNEQRRTFLAGDHVLPKITPNISLWPHSIADPLGAYLDSLPKLGELDVALVLPAHGPAFGTFNQRLEDLQSHHHERLRHMQTMAGGGRTAFEICDASFEIAMLSPHQTRFAMAETLSHLAFLVRRGRLIQEERESRIVFIDPQAHEAAAAGD